LSQNQGFAAPAVDPKKLAVTKSSNHVSKSRICCFCPRPNETRLGQRQQSSQEIKNLLPLPLTRRNSMGPKAAIMSQNQEFAASAVDPKKLAVTRGSNLISKSRNCCPCP